MIKISHRTQENVCLRKLNFLLLMFTAIGHHLKLLAPLALKLQRIGISARLLLKCVSKTEKTLKLSERDGSWQGKRVSDYVLFSDRVLLSDHVLLSDRVTF